MAFSDAFLKGFTAGKHEEEKNQQLLTALLNRRSSGGGGGSALYPSRVADNDPLARVNKASDDYEASQLRDKAVKQAEQEAMRQSEQENIKTEMLKRQLSAMPTPLDNALDRSSAAAGVAQAGAMLNDQAAVASQENRMAEEANRIKQARPTMYQGYVNRDMEKLTKGFNAAFPMDTIDREKLRGRDEDTKEEKDYMKFENAQTQFRTDDMGNTFVQYAGSKEWVPFNDQHMRQFMIASNPKLLKPVGSAGASKASAKKTTAAADADADLSAGDEDEVDTAQMSEKDKAKYLLDLSKDNRDTFKARSEYALKRSTDAAGEVDDELYAKAWKESGAILGDDRAQKQLGFPRPRGYNAPVAEAAGTKAAVELAKKMDRLKEVEGPQAAAELSRAVQAQLLATMGPNAMLAFQDELAKSGPEWFTGNPRPRVEKMGLTDDLGNMRAKSDYAGGTITEGLPDEVPQMASSHESVTIDGIPVTQTKFGGPPMVYDFNHESYRPATSEEIARLVKTMEHAYNSGAEESRALLAKIAKLAHAINTYGTHRKKGEPTDFQKFIQSQAQAMKSPVRANVPFGQAPTGEPPAPAPAAKTAAPPSKPPARPPESPPAEPAPKPKSALENAERGPMALNPAEPPMTLNPAEPTLTETKESLWQKYLEAQNQARKGKPRAAVEMRGNGPFWNLGGPTAMRITAKETKESLWKKYVTAQEEARKYPLRANVPLGGNKGQ